MPTLHYSPTVDPPPRPKQRRPEPSDLPPATVEDPAGWVILNKRGIRTDDSFLADAGTVACYPAFTRRHLRVSLRHAPPPVSTFIYYDFPDRELGEDYNSSDSSTCEDDKKIIDESEENGDVDESEEEEEEDVDEWGIRVIAAHGDSVLVKLSHLRCPYDYESIHLLYRAGVAGPPSLALLPERDFLTKSEQLHRHEQRSLHKVGTQAFSDEVTPMTLKQKMAEFCLFRHGGTQWELKEPVPIIQDDGSSTERLRTRGGRDTIITLGDRFLCWVRYETGFLLCDMADEESPKGYDDGEPKHSKNMGAAGASTTWAMNLTMDDPLMWVKDGEIDGEEIWGQPGYEECPIVSLDDPNIVCFLVNNCPFVNSYEDRKVWTIKLNIKTKALLSAYCDPDFLHEIDKTRIEVGFIAGLDPFLGLCLTLPFLRARLRD
ncbi:hypothetical protein HU200_009650 [Digitaria exilis]|uniref:DUF1618 domain-containing protein n=1 Tax=Digitaria exilis TaxID=1010633 RepID=A0A835FIS5_9POAL|nr:hypothetical protein HU200_009650 [Digitaria exilis]